MPHDELQRCATGLHVAAETHSLEGSAAIKGGDEDIFRPSPLIFAGQELLDLGQNRRAKVQFPQRPAVSSGQERLNTTGRASPSS